MNLQTALYLVSLLIAPLLTFAVGLYVWRHRTLAGATAFAWMLFATAWWGVSYVFQLFSGPDLATQVEWNKWRQFGVVSVTPLLLTFVLHYTGRVKQFVRLFYVALWLPALMILCLAFTNERHGLYWTSLKLGQSGPFTVLLIERGWINLLNVVYLNLLGLVAAFLLFRWALQHKRRIYRLQAIMVILSILASWVGNILFVTGTVSLELTSFTFALSGLGLTWAIFRYRLFRLAPVARDRVIEEMRDGMIVLDVRDRVVDINPAAAHMIGVSVSQAIGQGALEIFSLWPHLIERFRDVLDAREEIVVGEGEARRRYEIFFSPLSDRQDHYAGRVIILRALDNVPASPLRLTAEEIPPQRPRSEGSTELDQTTQVEFGLAKRVPWMWLVEYFLVPIQTDLEIPPGADLGWYLVLERCFTLMMRLGAFLLPVVTLLSRSEFANSPRSYLAFLTIEACLWVLALARGLPFNVRVNGFLFIFYALGLVETATFGYSAESFTFFMILVVSAALLTGRKGWWTVLSASLLTLIFFGWQIEQGHFIPLAMAPDVQLPSSLLRPFPLLSLFIMGAAGLSFAIITLGENLRRAWQLEAQAANLLKQERDLLDQRVRARTIELETEVSERKQAEEALKKQSYRLSILNAITHHGLESTDFRAMLQTFADQLGVLFDADGAFITLWDEAHQQPNPAAAYGTMRENYLNLQIHPGETTLTASVLKTGRTLVVEDVFNSPYVSPRIAARFPSRSLLGLPLIAGNQKLGAVIISFHEPHSFTLDDLAYGEQASSQIALAVARMQLLDSLQNELVERRRVEGALRASEERFRSIYESVEDVIYETDYYGQITGISPSVENQSGYKPEELIGRSVMDFYEFPEDYIAQDSAMEAQGAVNDFEIRLKKKNGDLVTVSVTAHIVFDENGQPVKTEGILRNITERKEIETRIGKINAELELRVAERTSELESANQLLSILGGAAIAVTQSLDLDMAFDQILLHARRIVPYVGANVMLIDGDYAIVGRRMGYEEYKDVKQFLPDIRFPITWATFQHMLTTGESLFVPDTAQYPAWHSTGRKDWVRAYIGVPLKVGVETIGFLNVSSDQPDAFLPDDVQKLEALAAHVTNALQNTRLLKQLETALYHEQTMRTQLVHADKLAALGRMVASIAHEINNPIQTVKNAFFLLEDEIEPNSPAFEYLRMAGAEANRIAELVRQLRDVYRPRMKETQEPVDITQLLEEVAVILAPQLKRSEVEWQLPEGNRVQLTGYSDQLKQVFINLGLNAIEAMEEAHGSLLRVCLHGKPGWAGIEFYNDGPVIPPEQIPLLFEPFFTTKSTGTGLGLAICHDIVQRHQGEIVLQSSPEAGTSFTVWLPVQSVDIQIAEGA